jgi:hypothetical protein
MAPKKTGLEDVLNALEIGTTLQLTLRRGS